MKRNQTGFSTVVLLLVVVSIGIIGFAGWHVWNSQKPNKTASTTTQDSAAKTMKEPETSIVLADQKLEAGWKVPTHTPASIDLRNINTGCSVNAYYTTNTAESHSPDIDQNKQTLESLRGKGYGIQEKVGTLAITTANGIKQLDSQALTVTGEGVQMYQTYAYIAKTDSYTYIRLACDNEADLASAETALLTLTFVKVTE